MFKVRFESEGLVQRLTGIILKAVNFQPAMNRIGDLLVASNRRNILSGGRPMPFMPTKAGNRPLIGRGRLLGSILKRLVTTTAVEVEAGSGLRYAKIHQFGGTITQQVSPRQVAFFWAQWYRTGNDMWRRAAIKYGGARFGKGAAFLRIVIPARRYFRIQDEDVVSIKSILANYILKGE